MGMNEGRDIYKLVFKNKKYAETMRPGAKKYEGNR